MRQTLGHHLEDSRKDILQCARALISMNFMAMPNFVKNNPCIGPYKQSQSPMFESQDLHNIKRLKSMNY